MPRNEEYGWLFGHYSSELHRIAQRSKEKDLYLQRKEIPEGFETTLEGFKTGNVFIRNAAKGWTVSHGPPMQEPTHLYFPGVYATLSEALSAALPEMDEEGTAE